MIDGSHVAEARISLSPTHAGGLRAPMASGGRSLLLNFPSLESPDRQRTIGAAIDPLEDAALEPGTSDVIVRLWFWAGEAQVYAVPGAQFTLWYAGRTVGRGSCCECSMTSLTESAE